MGPASLEGVGGSQAPEKVEKTGELCKKCDILHTNPCHRSKRDVTRLGRVSENCDVRTIMSCEWEHSVSL